MPHRTVENLRRELQDRLRSARSVPETHAAIRWGYTAGLTQEVIHQELHRDISRRRLWDTVLFVGSGLILTLVILLVAMLFRG